MKKSGLCLILLALCLCGCGVAGDAPSPPTSTAESLTPSTVPAASSAAPGEILESGSGINDHYYCDVDYFGMPDELTDSSFLLGKAGMAFHGSQPLMGPVVIRYGAATVIRTAILHGDSYEIYAAGPEALAEHLGDPAYVFDVVLEDPGAEELRAKEIRVSRWVLD